MPTESTLRSTTNAPTNSISPESYLFLQRWIHRESGIVLDENKAYLLQSRLTPILEREKLDTLETLCRQLRSGKPGMSRLVIEAMTTHETLFFRDRAPFDALRDHIVPALMTKRAKGQKLMLWSAAASSGQEAYSLAMMLMEMGLTSHEVSILGTDLSEKVLERARLGIYGSFELKRGLPANYREQYFQPHGKDLQVKDAVRQMVRFEQLDLRNSLRGHGPFDVVLCRNVLIYFDTPTKEKILAEMRYTLTRGGYLMLGTAETVGQNVPWLQRTVFGEAIAYAAV